MAAWEATEEVVTPLAESAPGGGWKPAELDTTPSPMVNVARGAANAVTFGQWDRARALLRGGAYGPALAEEVAKSKQAAKETPFLYGTGEAIGGAIPGMGLSSATSKALGTAARPLMQRMGIGAAEGGVLGAAQGAGNVYSGKPEDYLAGAGGGAAMGGVLGLASPAIGSTIAGTGRFMADRGMFGGYPKVITQAAQADEAGLRNVLRTPGAMLPDAGPSMLGVAQGAVTGTGGPGRTALVDALRARDVGTPGRITSELTQTFGPAPLPSRLEEGVRGGMRAMGPDYDAVLNTARAVDTSSLARDLETRIINERGPAKEAMRQARNMLNITGTDVLDPHPSVLQQTRTAVRGMQEASDDPNVRRALGNVYGQLTTELHRKVPGMRELDSRYLELGTQERALQPASQGARLFQTERQNVVRPEELGDVMREAAAPKGLNIGPSAEAFRMSQAARGELDRIIGTNKNDLLKLENVLGQPQDWNAQKLGVMFGQDKADRLMDVLGRERGFRQTYQDVVQGSQTAQRTAAKDALEAGRGKIPLETTAFGAATRGVQALYDRFRSGASETTRDRIAQIMATQNPAEMNVIVNQLLTTQRGREQLEKTLNTLGRGAFIGGGTAIGQRE